MVPPFPHPYPPPVPKLKSGALVALAFNFLRNKRLEWLGDIIVAAAIALSTHWFLVDYNVIPPATISEELRSGTQLAHLTLLYGLQLHDRDPNPAVGSVNPGIATMCDVFEAFVAAVALDCGLVPTLEWLVKLFDPWVAEHCRRRPTGTLPAQIKNGYDSFLRYLRSQGAAPHPNGPNVGALAAFGPAHVGFPPRDTARSFIIPQITACTVEFPSSYPPFPPAFLPGDAQVLTDALTNHFCHLHFGDSVVGNERYRALGDILWRLALATVAFDRLPGVQSDVLNDIALECTDDVLLAHLGTMFRLNEHVRILRPVGAEARLASHSQTGHGFLALVAAIYLRRGWAPLIAWVGELMWPWIKAAAIGGFRLSRVAQSHRANRERQRLMSKSKQPKVKLRGRRKA
ncbi:hypothetical protein C8R46DRAFT_1209368 [Mycena filopes]|nr:hypothetical protein C8R46DRAFT_1209368 [Mycena filopes]